MVVYNNIVIYLQYYYKKGGCCMKEYKKPTIIAKSTDKKVSSMPCQVKSGNTPITCRC